MIASREKSGDRREVLNITLAPTGASEPYYVRVEAREDGRNDYEFRYLTSTPPNASPSGLPTITGTAREGETLTADTSGISDGNGLTNVQYTYQWIRSASSTDTNIAGATSSTYVLTSDDTGKAVKVSVSFTDDAGYSATLTSADTRILATLTYRQNTDPPISQPQQQQQSPASSVSEPSGQDLPNASTTTGWLVVGDSGATGNLSTASDVDAFKIDLEAGKRYRIDVLGNGPRDFANGGTYSGELELQVGTLQSFDDTGLEHLNGIGSATTTGITTSVVNKGGGPDIGARSEFDVTATTTGTYLVKVISDDSSTSTGTYTVKASEITSEQAFGSFTSQWNSGRIRIDDTTAMTGNIASTGDEDWYMASFEAGKCYEIRVKGDHSDPDHDGGSLNDPKLKVMKFYDYYEKRFYDPHTLAYMGVPADEQDVAYYDEIYINPSKFELLNRADKVCNMVTPYGQTSSKLVCNYYCDDDSGQGNNSMIKVEVSMGGEGDYLIGVEGQGSTGTYSVYVEEINCPSN